MPTYEYLCKQCGHRFEVWQHMTDDALTVCPECGAEIHRVLYPAGIVFKGSGFYKTESRANGAGGREASESPAEAGESKSSPEGSKSTSESGAAKSGKSEGSSGGSSSGASSTAAPGSAPKSTAAE
jgi:putative FmdB family regulatory protein